MDDAGLLDAVFDAGGLLDVVDGLADVRRDGAGLRVRHLLLEGRAQASDLAHHVGGREDQVVLLPVQLIPSAPARSILPRRPDPLRRLRHRRLSGLWRRPALCGSCRFRAGRVVTPRTIWSPWRGSTPRLKATLTVSSNLALARLLTISSAGMRVQQRFYVGLLGKRLVALADGLSLGLAFAFLSPCGADGRSRPSHMMSQHGGLSTIPDGRK